MLLHASLVQKVEANYLYRYKKCEKENTSLVQANAQDCREAAPTWDIEQTMSAEKRKPETEPPYLVWIWQQLTLSPLLMPQPPPKFHITKLKSPLTMKL